MTAMWRQEAALHPTFQRFNRCLQDDWFLLPHELALQRAHADALAAAGLIGPQERTALAAALDDLQREFAGAGCPADDAEDLHTWIESELTRRAGAAGRKIHTARSRNDQVAALLKQFVVAAGGRLRDDLRGLTVAACEQAERLADLPLVLHTHQQFAVPGNAGFWLLRFAVSWARLRRRLTYLIGEWRSTCPLGSGAAAGSSLPVDRAVQAAGLGFDGPSPNALESTSCRDECLEFLQVAAQLALHLQSFAADVILFTQTPLQWVRYPAEFGSGSSMMPNKRNPDAMELLRGEAVALQAAEGQVVLLLKGLPGGYNRDLQCLKPVLRDAAERSHALCELTLEFIRRLQFDRERTVASMREGAIQATLVMEAKVRGGAALRDAHHETAAEVADDRLDALGDPAHWIAAYQTAGSAGPRQTRDAARAILEGLRD